MKEFIIGRNDAGQRLDRFVSKAAPLIPESLLQKTLRKKDIKINGRPAKGEARLAEGDTVRVYLPDEFFEAPREENAWRKITAPRLDIVYEDENILLVDKKPGVLCHSAGEWSWNTLIANIQAYLRAKGEWDPARENSFAPALCNRIDRNTGGIVIAAKNAEALRIMDEKVKNRRHRHRREDGHGPAGHEPENSGPGAGEVLSRHRQGRAPACPGGLEGVSLQGREE